MVRREREERRKKEREMGRKVSLLSLLLRLSLLPFPSLLLRLLMKKATAIMMAV